MSQHPEAIQWRNVRKIVKALADWGFGSPNDPNYGHCHITMTTGLTAKDGPDFSVIGLESFPTDISISHLRPLLDEVARRGEKMGGDGSSFTVTIDAEMWEQIKDHV
jgi:hypothetical protein